MKSHRPKIQEICPQAPKLEVFQNKIIIKIQLIGCYVTQLDSSINDQARCHITPSNDRDIQKYIHYII